MTRQIKNITDDDGVVDYTLNDRATISFNPADINTLKRIYDAFDALIADQDGYEADLKAAGEDFAKVYEIAQNREMQMRNVLDCMFDKPFCADLYGQTSVYALANGLPRWANLLMALIDETADVCKNQTGIATKRVNAYIAKYKDLKR